MFYQHSSQNGSSRKLIYILESTQGLSGSITVANKVVKMKSNNILSEKQNELILPKCEIIFKTRVKVENNMAKMWIKRIVSCQTYNSRSCRCQLQCYLGTLYKSCRQEHCKCSPHMVGRFHRLTCILPPDTLWEY